MIRRLLCARRVQKLAKQYDDLGPTRTTVIYDAAGNELWPHRVVFTADRIEYHLREILDCHRRRV